MRQVLQGDVRLLTSLDEDDAKIRRQLITDFITGPGRVSACASCGILVIGATAETLPLNRLDCLKSSTREISEINANDTFFVVSPYTSARTCVLGAQRCRA